MATTKAVHLIRIARLRRFVGIFARGGDRDAAAEALRELANASREGGLTADALRRARQAAQLLAEEPGEPGVRALIQLATICLETGATETAASAAEVARDHASELPEPARAELIAVATLLAALAHGIEGDADEARARLSEARDLLVAANQPAGAALALVQHGLLDVEVEHPQGAELCFAFARDFYRAAGSSSAAIEVAAVAARAFAAAAISERADRWFATGIAEADGADMRELATELTIERAAELERAGSSTEAVRVAADGAHRCAALGTTPAADALRSTVQLQLARMLDDPREALRHLEAAFELGIARRDPTALGGALDVLVSGLVSGRFADDSWQKVAMFRDRLTQAEFDTLADTADRALADLRQV
jgi:hypothetical protein